jgi:twitching motility protein PilT
MSDLTSLLAALELTGGERIVLRSNERPHLIVGDTRHELGTAPVPTTTTLEMLADQILSPAGKQALADQRVVVEPLVEHESAVPVRVMVRRIGAQMSVELQRDVPSSDVGHAAATAAAVPVIGPADIGGAEPLHEHVSVYSTVSGPGLVASSDTPRGILTDVTVKPAPSEARLPPPEPATGGRSSRSATTIPKTSLESEPLRPKDVAAGNIVDGSRHSADIGTLDYLIRQAVRRKASALYMRGGHPPIARFGDRVEPLVADPLEPAVIEKVAAALTPSGDRERSPSSAVWIREYEGTRQRWHAFSDDRGPGLVVHLAWQSREFILQRDIPRQVKRVCQEDDGIVVVSATATAGLLDMIAAIGNWTAGRRAGYLISIEPPGGLGHEIAGTFVSSRKVAGADREQAVAIQRAAYEAPDVLVVALPSGAAAEEALRAARTGCLIVLGIVAPTAARALESLLTHVAPQQEFEARQSLAAWFRCGFSYRALHTEGGGRKVVHDMLIATPEVCARLERGDVGSLERLQRSGADGMRSLDTALASAVVRGDISLRQAAIHAVNRREVVRMVRQLARERRRLRT